MSGGAFDYQDFHIFNIAESIQSELDKQGTERDKEYHYTDDPYPTYSEAIQARFREAIRLLKLGSIYAHRIDYYLSGDDGDETFLDRLEHDLKEAGYK